MSRQLGGGVRIRVKKKQHLYSEVYTTEEHLDGVCSCEGRGAAEQMPNCLDGGRMKEVQYG